MKPDDAADWSAAERACLRALGEDHEPPAAWEERVVGDLRSRGWLSSTRPRWRRSSAAAAALAALLVAFLGGWWGHARLSGADPGRSAGGERYLLALHRGDEPPLEGEALRERIAEYGAWAAAVGARMLDGARLLEATYLLRPDADDAVQLSEGSRLSTLGGYFLFTETSLERAVALARACPHLRHGGWVELRRLDPEG